MKKTKKPNVKRKSRKVAVAGAGANLSKRKSSKRTA